MKHIHTFDHLEQVGIHTLTGESCAAGYRILCDLTEFGRQVVREMLGLADNAFAAPWNNGDPGDPHIASFMMPPEMAVPLAVWGLGLQGATCIAIMKSGAVVGCFLDEGDSRQAWEELLKIHRDSKIDPLRRTVNGSAIPTGRVVHQMTGRTA